MRQSWFLRRGSFVAATFQETCLDAGDIRWRYDDLSREPGGSADDLPRHARLPDGIDQDDAARQAGEQLGRAPNEIDLAFTKFRAKLWGKGGGGLRRMGTKCAPSM